MKPASSSQKVLSALPDMECWIPKKKKNANDNIQVKQICICGLKLKKKLAKKSQERRATVGVPESTRKDDAFTDVPVM